MKIQQPTKLSAILYSVLNHYGHNNDTAKEALRGVVGRNVKTGRAIIIEEASINPNFVRGFNLSLGVEYCASSLEDLSNMVYVDVGDLTLMEAHRIEEQEH